VNSKPKTLTHGLLLDGKYVLDFALPMLAKLREFVPSRLHPGLEQILREFAEELAQCDVSERYREIE